MSCNKCNEIDYFEAAEEVLVQLVTYLLDRFGEEDPEDNPSVACFYDAQPFFRKLFRVNQLADSERTPVTSLIEVRDVSGEIGEDIHLGPEVLFGVCDDVLRHQYRLYRVRDFEEILRAIHYILFEDFMST